MIAYNDLEQALGERAAENILVAIDGLPASGKSTIAKRLALRHGLKMLCLDDFMSPPSEWENAVPAFPFPYFRNEEFADALRDLRQTGACSVRKYDWPAQRILPPEQLSLSGALLVEGCSVLSPDLAPLYDLRVFIASDASDTFEAAMRRDGGTWSNYWRDLFIPSVELYMRTNPRERADLIVMGRGPA